MLEATMIWILNTDEPDHLCVSVCVCVLIGKFNLKLRATCFSVGSGIALFALLQSKLRLCTQRPAISFMTSRGTQGFSWVVKKSNGFGFA